MNSLSVSLCAQVNVRLARCWRWLCRSDAPSPELVKWRAVGMGWLETCIVFNIFSHSVISLICAVSDLTLLAAFARCAAEMNASN